MFSPASDGLTYLMPWEESTLSRVPNEDYTELLMGSGSYLRYEPGTKEKKSHVWYSSGSILATDLWNMTYDDIFRIEMPDGAHLIGYTDDVAALIVARNVEEAKNEVMATDKTELIYHDITTCDTTLTTRKVINHLGIRLHPRMTFWAQIRHAAIQAAKCTSLLIGLMANIRGLIQSRRRLMMAITDSILLYGSEIWADALKVECRLRILSSVQRTAALRAASA